MTNPHRLWLASFVVLAVVGGCSRIPPGTRFELNQQTAGGWNRLESPSSAIARTPDPCGARFSTRGPVFVIDSTDPAALVHLGVMSHDRRWSTMRLVGPDGATTCVQPAPSLVELADRFERRDVLQLNTRLAVGRWEVWLGTGLNDVELDSSPVPFLVAPVTAVADADWNESIERSLATDRHHGGDSANAQRWTPADAVFDAATSRVSPQGDTCYRMFIRYDLSEPPPVGLVLQRIDPETEQALGEPRVVGLDARRGFAVGDVDFCASDGHARLVAFPGDSAARPGVRIFSTPRDEVRESAGRWAGQQPAILCGECQDSYRSCVRDGRPRCRQRFVQCRRRLDLDESCQP